jgi:hypothetical protein
MVKSLKIVAPSDDGEERFTFVVRALESEGGLEYSARLSRRGGVLARHDSAPLGEEDLGALLACMNATEENEGGRVCTIEVTAADDEVHTTADFPVARLLDETIVGRVYARLKSDLGM